MKSRPAEGSAPTEVSWAGGTDQDQENTAGGYNMDSILC